MDKKNLIQTLRLIVPANNAKVAPPLGPVLGQFGINIMSFCKQFNDQTSHLQKNILVPVIVFLYKDKSFKFYYKKPVVSFLIKQLITDYNYNINNKKDSLIASKSTSFNSMYLYYSLFNVFILKNFNNLFNYSYIYIYYNKDKILKGLLHKLTIKYKSNYIKLLNGGVNQTKNVNMVIKNLTSSKYIYIEHIYKVCLFKYGNDLNEYEYFYLCKNIIGTLKSMDIRVI